MQLHKKELKFKKALALMTEQNKIRDQIAGIKSIKLDVPIFNGYKKYFILRSDIANRQDAPLLRTILNKINHTIYSDRKDFKVRNKKAWVNREHLLKPYYLPWNVDTQRYKDEFEWFNAGAKKWFRHSHFYGCTYHCAGTSSHYHFHKTWMFDTEIAEVWLTHYKPVDGELESKLKEISHTMRDAQLWPVIGHHRGWDLSGGWDDRRSKLVNEMLCFELNEELNNN